jgi:predicted ATP-grasp superfamily ATP-dependent carboligase
VSRAVERVLTGVRTIVTDADTRLGLYVIRSLGRAGSRITALTAQQTGSVLGFSSRYVTGTHRLPSGKYEETLPDTIASLASRHDVLVPVSTFSISITAGSADRFDPLVFYIPSLPSLRAAMDKGATTAVAREVGIPVPETYERLDPATIGQWADKMYGKYPLVVKFRDDKRSSAWSPADRYRIVRSAAELSAEYSRMHTLGEYPLVQEYIEGDGYGFFAMIGPQGEPVATFCHRRLREYPISGGPSTLCESIYDETLVELGTRLLRALNWRGVAMVEFKRDQRTGEFKLLEVNPRFWGSLPLALHCGVNFPVYQTQLALGLTPAPKSAYPTGRKMRFLLTDLLAVREQWRNGDKRAIATRYLKELFDLSIKDGLFDIDDPRPFATYLSRRMKR